MSRIDRSRQLAMPEPYHASPVIDGTFVGRVFGIGPYSATPPVYVSTHPVDIFGPEAEGQPGTLAVDTAKTVVVAVLRGIPAIGDDLICDYEGNRWIAEKNGTSTPPVTTGGPICDPVFCGFPFAAIQDRTFTVTVVYRYTGVDGISRGYVDRSVPVVPHHKATTNPETGRPTTTPYWETPIIQVQGSTGYYRFFMTCTLFLSSGIFGCGTIYYSDATGSNPHGPGVSGNYPTTYPCGTGGDAGNGPTLIDFQDGFLEAFVA